MCNHRIEISERSEIRTERNIGITHSAKARALELEYILKDNHRRRGDVTTFEAEVIAPEVQLVTLDEPKVIPIELPPINLDEFMAKAKEEYLAKVKG